MQAANFDLEMTLVERYVDRFMRLLAPAHYEGGNTSLRILAQGAANDSAYTYANLVYGTKAVALACCIFAIKTFGLPLPVKDGGRKVDETFDLKPLLREGADERWAIAVIEDSDCPDLKAPLAKDFS